MKNLQQLWILFAIVILSRVVTLDAAVSSQPIAVISEEADREKLLLLMSGEWVARALYVTTKLEIADCLKSGPKTVEELAQITNANPESLYRILHMLAGFAVFEEIAPNTFANTKMSALLAKADPHTLHSLAIFYGEDIHKSLDELLTSIQTGTPAFELAFKQPVFNYFRENPPRKALFQESMKEKSQAVIQSALSQYDFSPFNTIYDIGGGHGHFMQAILSYYPTHQGVLFELPEVVASVKQYNPSLEKNHCALIAGDFFKSLPEGGDLYLLKSVLHDWDDEKCCQILSNCHRAMDTHSRLLIIEVVLKPKDLSLYANCMDVLMLAITGGKERSLDHFQQMLDKTGFVLEHVYPTSTEFSILEVKKK